MLLLLLNWCYFLLLYAVLGCLAFRLLRRLAGPRSPARSLESPLLLVFSGFFVLLYLLTVGSLLAPMDLRFHCLFLAFLLALAWAQRAELRRLLRSCWALATDLHPLTWLLTGLSALLILFASTDAPVYNLDPGRYHFQNILWAKSYSVVPGVANLHDRFGYCSSLYSLYAMADVLFMEGRSFHVFNGQLLALVVTAGLVHLDRVVFKRRPSLASLFAAAFALYLVYYFPYLSFWYLSCPSPDLPANLGLFAGFFLVALELAHPGSADRDRTAPLLLLTLFWTQTAAIRISGVFLLVPLLLFAWRAWTARPRPSRTLLLAAGLAAALLSPSLLKSYLASGWPLYPVPFGPFDPDWKLPSETVHRTFDWIRRAGAVEALGGAGPEAIAEARRLSAGDLLLLWLRRQLRNAGPLYAVLAPAGPLVLMLAFSRRARRDAAGHRVVVLLASLSFLGWLLGAPLFRYGFGYVGVLFAALASCLLRPGLVSGGVRRPIRVLGLATGVALVARMCTTAAPVSAWAAGLAYPIDLLRYFVQEARWLELSGVPVARFVRVDLDQRTHLNQVLYDASYARLGRRDAHLPCGEGTDELRPEAGLEHGYRLGDVCVLMWMAPLPSVTHVPAGLEWRGDRIEDGFRTRAVPAGRGARSGVSAR